jgi:phosphosulfolactate synthase (CoM biosynthesis protein A)
MATVQVAHERAFSFLGVNERQGKPRTEGITEIQGPYYTPMGRRSLEDIVDTKHYAEPNADHYAHK